MGDRFEQFCTSISSIYRSIQKIERVEMAKYGLKGPHAQCLVAMRRFPGGVTAARLSEICEKDKAAISRTVAELEQAGMVRRQETGVRRYCIQLYLTATGLAVAASVNQLVYLAVQQASEGYDEENRQVFLRVLHLIAENLQAICAEGLQSPETEQKNG